MNLTNKIDDDSYEKRILITGVSGLVGRILFNDLMKKYSSKYYLIGIDQHFKVSPRYQLENDFNLNEENLLSIRSDRFIQCDITNEKEFHQIISQHRIQIIIHLAALLETHSNPNEIYRINIQGTKNVFQAVGIERIIYVSTVRLVFGYLEMEPYRSIYNETFDDQTTIKRIRVDDRLICPQFENESDEAYWKSKYQGEEMAKEILEKNSTISIICVRLGWVNIRDEPGRTFYRTVWLSHRDLCSFFDQLLQTRLSLNGIYFAISNNHRLWVDIDSAKEDLNFIPQDGTLKCDHNEEFVN